MERRHATCSAASGRSNTVTLRPGCARASSGARAPRQPAGGRDALCGLALWGLRKPRGESFSLSTTKRCSRMGGGPCYETQPAVGAMAGVSRRPWGPPRPAERGAECWGRGRRPGKGGSSERSCEGRTLPSSLLRGADACRDPEPTTALGRHRLSPCARSSAEVGCGVWAGGLIDGDAGLRGPLLHSAGTRKGPVTS